MGCKPHKYRFRHRAVNYLLFSVLFCAVVSARQCFATAVATTTTWRSSTDGCGRKSNESPSAMTASPAANIRRHFRFRWSVAVPNTLASATTSCRPATVTISTNWNWRPWITDVCRRNIVPDNSKVFEALTGCSNATFESHSQELPHSLRTPLLFPKSHRKYYTEA